MDVIIPTVIFRADGSPELGYGHVSRCTTLANEFRKRDIQCRFALRAYNQNIINKVGLNGFPVDLIPRDADVDEEAKALSRIALENRASHLILDISNAYFLTRVGDVPRYISTLKATNVKIVMIDGVNQDSISTQVCVPVDTIIIPHVGACVRKYFGTNETRFLLGPDFFVGRRDLNWNKNKKEIKGLRVLITMGGADPEQLSLLVIKAIAALDDLSLTVRLVLGPAFSVVLKRTIKQAVDECTHRVQLVDSPDSMSVEFEWADVVIASGGTTKYEIAEHATAAIILSSNENEDTMNDEYAQTGAAIHVTSSQLKDVTRISGAIRLAVENPGLRRKMEHSAENVVDGRGAERIISDLFGTAETCGIK
jgi:UDP-2,4-diacetamido-2,4,6-trideoxy-beta-L-altropyranose hydrolase